MPFQVRTEKRLAGGGLDGTVAILEGPDGTRAEVWPALGFNCYHWRTASGHKACDLLFADPQLFRDRVPTRSGIPILFPFPNRIRDGRYTWDGREYQLPLTDGPKKNAIHGFACRKPWRAVDQGANASEAWITGEFRGKMDAPESLEFWPADYQLRVTIRLRNHSLRVEAAVHNPDQRPLPFGLGFHPYFQLPLVGGASAEECQALVPARRYWELVDCLPTGHRPPVDSSRDLNTTRCIADLQLDDILTDLPPPAENTSEGLGLRGTIRQPQPSTELKVFCSPSYRDLVLFTPVHRRAFCIEPYTGTTNAINLQQQGIDAGLLVLPPGQDWNAVVELVVA